LLAARILSVDDDALAERLQAFADELAATVAEKDREVRGD
jgi:phosphoribosylcarboxyaminoimidazole (NCAIR) mutase